MPYKPNSSPRNTGRFNQPKSQDTLTDPQPATHPAVSASSESWQSSNSTRCCTKMECCQARHASLKAGRRPPLIRVCCICRCVVPSSHVNRVRAATTWCLDYSREFHPVLMPWDGGLAACYEPRHVAQPPHSGRPSATSTKRTGLPTSLRCPCRTSNTGPDRLRSFRLQPSQQ
jgi:hypothetical protein